MFGIPAVVAINSFPTDTAAEVEAIREVALAAGARDAVVATHFVDGGARRGGPRRGRLGGHPRRQRADFRLLYPDEMPLAEQDRDDRHPGLRRRRRRVPARRAQVAQAVRGPGLRHLPVCMAKTQYSLSHDAALKGRPTGFTVPIREVRLSAGAGFVTPLCGEMRTMPGLPSARAARRSTSTPTGTSSGCSSAHDRHRAHEGAPQPE